MTLPINDEPKIQFTLVEVLICVKIYYKLYYKQLQLLMCQFCSCHGLQIKNVNFCTLLGFGIFFIFFLSLCILK